MIAILINWLGASLGLWFSARLLSGVKLATPGDALWAGALLGVLNYFLHWLIFVVLGVITLGIGFLLGFITTWVASAIIIRLTAGLSSRLEVRGWVPALVTAFLVAGANAVVSWLFAQV